MTTNKQTIHLVLLRVVVCLIIASHGWHRFMSGGYQPFGDWLTSQGFPFGLALASAVTFIEIVGSISLLFGFQVIALSAVFAFIYFMGLVLVHWQHGWFVVGSGSNGIEYSVLLITALFCLAYSHYLTHHQANVAVERPE